MRTLVKKTLVYEVKRHDFDNEFAYIEVWNNNILKDCFFAEKDGLFMDGSLRPEYKKYFYSPYSGEEIEKEIKPIRVSSFKWFDKLYYIDESGEIFRIDGSPASEVSYEIDK